MTGQAIATVPSSLTASLGTTVAPLAANVPMVVETPVSLSQWLDTVSRATHTVLNDFAGPGPSPESVVVLLRAIDGASEALGRDNDSALREGLRAAIQTARTTSIVAQTANARLSHRALVDELCANITKTLEESNQRSGDTCVAFLRGAMRTMAVPLEGLDPALAKQAVEAIGMSFWSNTETIAHLQATFGAIRSSLPLSAQALPASASRRRGLFAWLFG